MHLYFINSDAASNGGISYHNDWLARGIAVTSGGPQYRKKIAPIPRGSTLLLHAKDHGVVAVGTVLDDAEQVVRAGEGTVSPVESEEYHRRVAWRHDLRHRPMPYRTVIAIRNNNPRHAVELVRHQGEALLAAALSHAEEADVAAIRGGAGTPAWREAVVLARRGQGKYREQLLDLWERRCAVTGCTLLDVVRASHALPFSRADIDACLDPHNGLPLVANLDALFDRGLIGFDATGDMICHPDLGHADRAMLGVPAPLRKAPNARQQAYLAQHRALFGL